MPPPEICPQCGATVPARARACPSCGSDENTGWSDDAVADRLDLPDDSFDHDEFVRSEWGPEHTPGRNWAWVWWLVAVILIAILLGFLRPH